MPNSVGFVVGVRDDLVAGGDDSVDQPLTVLWSRLLHLDSGPETLAAASDAVIVAERHSRLVRLDLQSGELLWEQRVEDCWGTAVIAGQRCLYLSQAGVLHCLDVDNGRRLWSTTGLGLHRYVSICRSTVLLGGWRGYRRLVWVDLASGDLLPLQLPGLTPGSSLAWPLPVSLGVAADVGADAFLVASADQPTLALVDARAGAVVDKWSLPAPVRFPDSGVAYRIGTDGRIVFLSGARTVMALSPDNGVATLWRHSRDLAATPPMVSGRKLWLAETDCVTIVDLHTGVSTEVKGLRLTAACGTVPMPEGALFACSGNQLVAVDRAGTVVARVRLSARIDRLLSDGRTRVYAIGKGHLTAIDVGMSPSSADSAGTPVGVDP
ncbi:outer membrane protein assembly factor BamB family protein [Micromonospora sp. NBC_01813]|uniref:outer membrane protein assembly factor BamB family protein n=1 Tax=Micromonospora sp. NBC_01813 TaxID=2975988 RepID=UPI002DDC4F16|nr:PQQ-binding-like beta-propeller repeat protein [Micromonospora sp. NBC_01813]WSA06494.1 PQQ-like beta-propeller repeat protein [Micromonospora sp. NBC_01813]